MILVDTSVWVDHFRSEDKHLSTLLIERQVLIHSIVVGELACGNLKDRSLTLRRLDQLPQAERLNDQAVRFFIERHLVFGQGAGFSDMHLLASAHIGQVRGLWSRDKQLHRLAKQLGIAYPKD